MARQPKKTDDKRITPAFRAQAGKGRPKGVPNKTTTLLKDAILQAAAEAGGKDGLVGYLKAVAITKPESFTPLLGKVLPMQVTGNEDGPIQIKIIREIVGGK